MKNMTIKSSLILCSTILLALVTACGGVGDPAVDEYRQAVPSSDQLALDVPRAEAEAGKKTFALVGDQAQMYRMTYDATRGLNGSIWASLKMIETIVQYPASTVKDGVATWGPHTDALEPLTWLLVVKKEKLPTHYSYVLTARNKGDTSGKFVPIIAGSSRRGIGGYVGVYAADGTAMNLLDPAGNPETGRLVARYDTRFGKRAVHLALGDYSEAGEQAVDLAYRYVVNHTGAGLFRFVAKADLHKNGSAEEYYAMATQWDNNGRGRGDALISGGDLPAGLVVHQTECWDDSFGRVFYTDNVDMLPTEGDASQCLFGKAPSEDEPAAIDSPELPENGVSAQ